MKWYSALLFIGLGLPLAAYGDPPYRFVVVADPDSKAQAEQFVALMKKTKPFSLMGKQIEFVAISGSASLMKCGNRVASSPRLVECNLGYINQIARPKRPDRVLVFTSRGHGGSGGSIPIASLDYPLTTQLHELLHSFGLEDEYEYSEAEAKYYCAPSRSGPNIASFKPGKPAFSSDGDARSVHAKDIPWFSAIKSRTRITSGSKLGTAAKQLSNEDAALYRGGNCNRVVPTWKPYANDTIMKSLTSTAIPPILQQAIVASMNSSRLAPIRLTTPHADQPAMGPSSKSAGEAK